MGELVITKLGTQEEHGSTHGKIGHRKKVHKWKTRKRGTKEKKKFYFLITFIII